MGHPKNAVISLFLFLAYRLVGDETKGSRQWTLTQSIIEESPYWEDRFNQYDLIQFIDNPPDNEKEVQSQLQSIRSIYDKMFKVPE